MIKFERGMKLKIVKKLDDTNVRRMFGFSSPMYNAQGKEVIINTVRRTKKYGEKVLEIRVLGKENPHLNWRDNWFVFTPDCFEPMVYNKNIKFQKKCDV